jgi:hypothetical protein
VRFNSGKRLLVALTVVVLAVVAGIVAHRGGGMDAAPQHVAAQPESRVASSTASAVSYGAQITAALKAAEAVPHGEIGTAAVATKP